LIIYSIFSSLIEKAIKMKIHQKIGNFDTTQSSR